MSDPFPAVPGWAHELVSDSAGTLRLTGRVIDGARQMSAASLRSAVARTYGQLFSAGLPHTVRVWNVVPGITATLDGHERYLAFNAGRHDAFAKAFPDFPANLPAASGVGSLQDDTLEIHVLSSSLPGVAVENPRQVPAYRYSEKYGKLPPCFSRAMTWADHVFLSGTAAILGEDTRLEGDLSGQFEVTLENLGNIIPLGCEATHLRAYVPRKADESWVGRELADRFAGAAVEVVAADLCRKNLMVEIEGLAVSRE